MKRPLPLAAGLIFATACGGNQVTEEPEEACPQNLPTAVYQTYLQRPVDTNGDCAADFWKLYEITDDDGFIIEDLSVLADPDNFHLIDNQRIRQKWLDLNFDGAVDMTREYDVHERLVGQQVDLDFDGANDRVDTFDQGILISRATDENNDGELDTTRFYREGVLYRMELDSDGDGEPDTWRFYEEDRLVRVGFDTDGDGAIDDWARAEAVDASEAATPARPDDGTSDETPTETEEDGA